MFKRVPMCLFLLRGWVIGALPLFGAVSDSTDCSGIRRVRAHILVEDRVSALREAKILYANNPDSQEVASLYIETLSLNGQEEQALECLHALRQKNPEMALDRHLLEELAWGVIHKGISSTQYAVRLCAMTGAYLTRDARAVTILKHMLRDSNAIIRSVALQMVPQFSDSCLQEEVCRLLEEEKIWFVRLDVIKAAGMLRMKRLSEPLQSILSSEKNTLEERSLAAEALVRITDSISLQEFLKLAQNNRSGMRHLACLLASHFRLLEAKDKILELATDAHPDVRIAALNALGLLFPSDASLASFLVKRIKEDSNPAVSITATWALALVSPKESTSHFLHWLETPLPENRRLAAAALSATGGRLSALAEQILQQHSDPYVRVNVALGLLGQRKVVSRCAEEIHRFLIEEKKMWMWDDRANPLFNVLSPSQVRHVDQIPNYPESVDQMTRLNLVSLLAVIEDPRAREALKHFLQNRSWGITGVAAATLIQEGDESALDVVRELLDDGDPNVRLQACFVLAFLGHDETVIPRLQKAYAESDHERKLHILEALGNIGREENFSFFIEVFHEPFQILRIAAASGLIQSLNR